MRKLLAFVYLLAFLLIVCVLPIAAGRIIARRISKTHPSNAAVTRIEPARLILSALMVALLVSVMPVRELAPESIIGLFLNRPYGLIAGAAIAVGLYALICGIAAAAGYPIQRGRRKVGV
jgi:hypothetical protein